jgi:hypothetical protein
MTKKTTYLVVAALLLISNAVASTDPFIGKWTLDVHHSKYPAGTCPKRMVIEMEPAGPGIHYRSEATYSNGRVAHSQYTADYSGKEATVMGAHAILLPVSLKRLDSHTVVASYTKGFEVVATSRRVVSADRRRMTITTTSKDQAGKKATTIGVYTRE